jgi:hypothetical protein
MVIELHKEMTLHPGTFHAVIAPGKVMVTAPGSNTDLRRFLFLYVSDNNSRLLSSTNRPFMALEVV